MVFLKKKLRYFKSKISSFTISFLSF